MTDKRPPIKHFGGTGLSFSDRFCHYWSGWRVLSKGP